jgi:hypothetical protein
LKKLNTKKAGGGAHGVDPKFKPQYCKKKQKTKNKKLSLVVLPLPFRVLVVGVPGRRSVLFLNPSQ